MPAHAHEGRIVFNQSGYGVNAGRWTAYINGFSGPLSDTGNNTLTNVN
jgi:hypothetical protein